MRRIALGLTLGALVGLLLTWHGDGIAQTFGLGNFKRITTQRVTETGTDTGSGAVRSITVTTAEVGYVEVDCQDTNGGCSVTLSETGAREGQDLSLVFLTSNSTTISDSSGVQELNAGVAFASNQYDAMAFRYIGDRWVETWRSQPQVGTTNTAILTNKTLTSPTLTTPVLGSGGPILTSTTTTLTDAQIKALPTTGITVAAAPGSNRMLVPLRAILDMDASAGAYTNVDTAAFLFLDTVTGGNLSSNYLANDTSPTLTYLTDFLGATPQVAMLSIWEDARETDQWGNLAAPVSRSASVNNAIRIRINNNGSGNLTGGNAANSLVVTIVSLDVGI